MAKHKKGSIAIPFLLTFLVALILIGGSALYVYKNVVAPSSSTAEETENNTSVPSEDNRGTVLFILDLDDPGVSSDVTMMLIRAIPDKAQLICVPVSTNMVASVDGKKNTVGEFYVAGGAIGARTAIESALDVTIDKYIKLNDTSFQKICSIFGGLNYSIPDGVYGFTAGQQYLTPDLIQKLISYPYYETGDEQRMVAASSIISSMINQALGTRIGETLDNSFQSIVNIIETDITAIDYESRKRALKYLFNNGNSPAQFRNPTGEWSSSRFVVDEAFISDLKGWFSYNNVSEAPANEAVSGISQDTSTSVQTAPEQTTVQNTDDQQIATN